jgi:alkanesulfonate monooxygenase SsuD/methylene tetrahydromethanopterin reductase-like flavin-dependent oxidoreductase (luciferase family)
MQRAVTFADAWDAPYADPDELRTGLARLRRACEDAGRDPATLGVSGRGIPAETLDQERVEAYAALGVTDIGVTVPYGDVEHALSSLEQLATRCLGS